MPGWPGRHFHDWSGGRPSDKSIWQWAARRAIDWKSRLHDGTRCWCSRYKSKPDVWMKLGIIKATMSLWRLSTELTAFDPVTWMVESSKKYRLLRAKKSNSMLELQQYGYCVARWTLMMSCLQTITPQLETTCTFNAD